MGTSQSSYDVSPSKEKMDENSNATEEPALGIESCAIPSNQITASSSADTAPAFFARLNSSKAWYAGSPADCFLEVDLNTVHYVTAVATQGNPAGNKDYVMKYKLQYSKDGMEWEFYKENYKQVLEGNTDHCSVFKRTLDPKITARYVRFWPTAWFQWPCLRVELFGKPAPLDEMVEETANAFEIERVSLTDEEENAETLENVMEVMKEFIEVKEEIKLVNGGIIPAVEEDEVQQEEDTTQDFQDAESEVETSVTEISERRESSETQEIVETPKNSTENNGRVIQVSHEAIKQETRGREGGTDDFRRLLEVKKRLEFEAELRSLKEEQKVELRRKKKRVTLGYETPEMFSVPRRVYAEMWGGDTPSGSIECDLDKSATENRSMIERQNGGAPLAKLDDDIMDAGSVELQTRTVTRTTVTTVVTRGTSGNQNNKDESKVQPLSASSTQGAPDNLFLLLNGFSDEPVPYAARASCEHLHPTDPAVQAAMESSFHERLDSLDLEGGSPLSNKRFSGLDLLQSPYNAVSGDDIERLLAWEDESLSGWIKVKKSRDYEIWKGTAVDGGPPIIKATMTLKDIPYNEARRRITDLDIRKEWDKTFDEIIFLERSYNLNVIYCAVKKQGLTLAVLDETDPDEPYHASIWSITEHSASPSAPKSRPLRYETIISGLVIRPIEDGVQSSKVTLLCQIKGSVAAPLKNTFLTGNPEKWLDMLKKYKPKKKVLVL